MRSENIILYPSSSFGGFPSLILSVSLLAVFFLSLQSNVIAQNHNFNISSLTTKDGLSSNHATAVLEDRKGFIWIATYDGLNRWNGYEFDVFKKIPGRANSLPGNFIISLEEDQSGNIWIGTNNSGLVKYNPTEERFYRYSALPGDENSIPGNIIRYIKVDTENNVWIGSNYGLARYLPETDSFKRYQFPKGMSSEATVDIRRIVQKNEGELVVQNNHGLYNLNIENEIIQKVGYDIPFYNESLFTQNEPFCYDSFNNLWIGSVNGLIRYNTRTGDFKVYKNDDGDHKSISSVTFSTIFEDSQKNVWIGTSNKGVNKYNRATDDFTVIQQDYNSRKSITNDIITHIYEDSNSNLWFSTQEGGVNYFNYSSRQIEYFTHNHLNEASISSNKIGSFHEDKAGNIWVGTKDGGLNKFIHDKKTFERYFINTSFVSPSILAIEDHSSEALYVTGWETGLYSFDIQTGASKNLMENETIENKPLSINIKGMEMDSKNRLWLATHDKDGILVFDPANKQFYGADNPGPFDESILNVEYAVSFLEDSKSRLWIIAYTGVYMYDSILHTFRHDAHDTASLGSNYTFDIFEDSSGNIWIGNSSGLDKMVYKNGEWAVTRVNDRFQLPKNIKGILEDEDGNLWLSSHQEITKFNPETGKLKHFDVTNEMPNQEFYERSRLKSSNGEMYFGGINGFLKFHPDSLPGGEEKPRVHIVDFQIFNESQGVVENSPLTKTISETDEINLAYNQSVLTFEFAGLSFNPYQKLEYAYMMEGFDEQWYFVGDKRFATYTNLPPGEYRFHVRVAEGNTIGESGTSLALKISPPLWMTGWAYGTYLLIIGLVFYFFRKSILYREKLKNELKLEKLQIKSVMETNLMKLRFFTNVSHEFRTPLTLIKAPIEKLLRTVGNLDKEEQSYHYELIANNTNKLLSLVDQLMDYRKLEAGSLVLEPSKGDLVGFCRKVWSVFYVLAEKSNISYEFETNVDSHVMSFDADKLDKIISNLLSNAFKNTRENGHITIQVQRVYENELENRGVVNILVKDDGVGIPTREIPKIFQRFYSVTRGGGNELKGTGIGLALSKELAELHNGKISVESGSGEGATFKLTLPFGNILNRRDNIVEINREARAEKSIQQIESRIFGPKRSEKERVLIVEDDEELRLFLEKELSVSYEVLQGKNGEEGLEKALLELPDIIISDVTMPQLDGFEFCRIIKSDERSSHIPLILLTARHSQEKHLEGLESGADDYVVKPFNVEILKIRISNLLRSRTELKNKFRNSTGLEFEGESLEDKDSALIQRIIDIVLENIVDEKINGEFIAERVNMSRSLVYLKIEALTGQSVNEFVRNIRLKKAVQLLKSSSKNITEIAYAVGFSSQSYFTRSFVKQFGVSPKEYLNKEKAF